MTQAYINRIATAVPDDDVHGAFVTFADQMLEDPRVQPVFRRMAARSGIRRRFSVLTPNAASTEFTVNAHEFYTLGSFPDTAKRMQIFERFAPRLAQRTLDKLKLSDEERRGITHVLVTSCTGLYAPGLDFDIIDHLGLDTSVERTMIGFMGCYAAINGLKQARHIVRSEPAAKVLLVNLELCTLHLQETQDLEQVLSFLVFGDGCAASLISAEPTGFAMDSFRSLADSRDARADYLADPRRRLRHAALRQGSRRDRQSLGSLRGRRSRQATQGRHLVVGGAPGREVGAGCGGEGAGVGGGCAGGVAPDAGVLREHELGDGDVRAGAADAGGAAGGEGLRDVVRAGADGGDDALPCGLMGVDLSRRVSAVGAAGVDG